MNVDIKPFAPGSETAVKNGCTCPVLDNNHGRGAYLSKENDPVFWYNKDCPLHGKSNDIDPKEKLTNLL